MCYTITRIQKRKKLSKVSGIGTQTSPSDFISEKNVKFYTGLASLTVFLTLVEGLKSFLPARKFKNILIQDQILLVLLRLRLGLLFQDLGSRFLITQNEASRIFKLWIKVMSSELSILYYHGFQPL